MPTQVTLPAVAAHGATRLPSVEVDDYNVELKDDEGFIGDRASKGAFRNLISNWRMALENVGADPLKGEDSEELSKGKLDELLTRGILKQRALFRARSRISPKSLRLLSDVSSN